MKINPTQLLFLLLLLSCDKGDEASSGPEFEVIDSSIDGVRDVHYFDENNGILVFKDSRTDQSFIKLKINGEFSEVYRTEGVGANPELVMASNTKGYFIASGDLYLTTDRGSSWTLIENSPSMNDLFPITEDKLLAFASGFIDEENTFKVGLFHSTDGGFHWSYITDELRPINNIYFINEQIGFIGSDDVVYRTSDGGINWETINLPRQGEVFDIFFTDDLNGYLTFKFSDILYGTSNSGLSWDMLGEGDFDSFREVYFRDDGKGIITADGVGTTVWYSPDFGNSIELLIRSQIGSFSPQTPIIPINENTVIVLAEGIVYKINL